MTATTPGWRTRTRASRAGGARSARESDGGGEAADGKGHGRRRRAARAREGREDRPPTPAPAVPTATVPPPTVPRAGVAPRRAVSPSPGRTPTRRSPAPPPTPRPLSPPPAATRSPTAPRRPGTTAPSAARHRGQRRRPRRRARLRHGAAAPRPRRSHLDPAGVRRPAALPPGRPARTRRALPRPPGQLYPRRGGPRAGRGPPRAASSPAGTPSSPSPAPPAAASPSCSTRSPASPSRRPAYGGRPRPRPSRAAGATAPPALIDRLGIPGRLAPPPAARPGHRGAAARSGPGGPARPRLRRRTAPRTGRPDPKLVDAVIWVVDPEKYADAVLHERYLRPMAGHAEIMFVVLNQVDRLLGGRRRPGPGRSAAAAGRGRHRARRARRTGRHRKLALSALTGEGVGELREALGQFVAERGAAARRVAADLDSAAAELRPVYATGRRVGLSEEAREEFAARLADAVGATAAGEAAERAWLRNAGRACGTPLAAAVALVPGPFRLHDRPPPGTRPGRRGGHGPPARRTGGPYGVRTGLGRVARALGPGGARGGRTRFPGAVRGAGRPGGAGRAADGPPAAAGLVAGGRTGPGGDDPCCRSRAAPG